LRLGYSFWFNLLVLADVHVCGVGDRKGPPVLVFLVRGVVSVPEVLVLHTAAVGMWRYFPSENRGFDSGTVLAN